MSQSVIGALRVNLGLDSAAFSKGAKQVESRTKKMVGAFQKIGAAVSVVGVGIAAAIRGQLGEIDSLAKQSQKIGISVSELSKLQFAAEQSGVSMAALQTGIARFSRVMVESADDLADIGVSVRDAAGNMRSTDAVFADVAEVIAAMEDGAEKTALAMDLFGRSGADLVPLLNQGKDGIAALMAEADALGLTITEETATAVQKFNDDLNTMGRRVTGFTRIITAELAPSMAKLSAGVSEFSKAFSGMSPEMRKFSAIAAAALVAVAAIVVPLAAAAAILGKVGLAIVGVVTAVSLVSAAFAAWWPELLALEERIQAFQQKAVAALVDAFNSALEFLQSLPARFREMGGQIIQGLVAGIRESAAAVRDAVVDVAIGARDWFAERLGIDSPSKVFMQFGRDLLQGLADGITGNGAAPIRSLKDVLDRILGILDQFTSQIIDGAIGGLIGGLFKGFGGSGSGSVSLSDVTTSFGGFRASGGPVKAGTSYVVGERGPELFTPRQSGSIMPGGGGLEFQQTIIDQRGRNAPPIESRTRREGNRVIQEMMIRANADAVRRGRLDDAFGERFGSRAAPVPGS